jgi:hypothetical protein
MDFGLFVVKCGVDIVGLDLYNDARHDPLDCVSLFFFLDGLSVIFAFKFFVFLILLSSDLTEQFL